MEIFLAKNELITFEGDARNLNLTCLNGTVWLTQRNDPTDHIIQTGASFTGNRKGRIVVIALDAANLLLAAPRAFPRISGVNRKHSYRIDRTPPQQRLEIKEQPWIIPTTDA